jgi:hypothetical protein
LDGRQRYRQGTGAGKTGRRNLENVKLNKNQRVVSPVSQPISLMGSAVGLQRSLAPGGAVVVARMTDIFPMSCEHEGPKGGPGMRVARRRAWKAPAHPRGNRSGGLRKHAAQVGPARKGAVAHSAGGKAEVVCYADI